MMCPRWVFFYFLIMVVCWYVFFFLNIYGLGFEDIVAQLFKQLDDVYSV